MMTEKYVALGCIWGLLFTMLRSAAVAEYHANYHPEDYVSRRHHLTLSSSLCGRILMLLVPTLALVYLFDCYWTLYYVVIAALVSVFFPYLRKSSPYMPHCMDCKRDWWDKLIYSSLIYLVAAIVAAYNRQYPLSFVCAVNCLGSSLYHRNREGQFFNLDNIFATSQFLVYGYSAYDSYHTNFYYFLLGAFGFPLPMFFLIACGDPADIVYEDRPEGSLNDNMHSEVTTTSIVTETTRSMSASGKIKTNTITYVSSSVTQRILRSSRELYDNYHTMWHVFSGLGPILASIYFAYYQTPPILDLKGYGIDDNEVLPMLGLLMSLSINIAANYCSAVPFN